MTCLAPQFLRWCQTLCRQPQHCWQSPWMIFVRRPTRTRTTMAMMLTMTTMTMTMCKWMKLFPTCHAMARLCSTPSTWKTIFWTKNQVLIIIIDSHDHLVKPPLLPSLAQPDKEHCCRWGLHEGGAVGQDVVPTFGRYLILMMLMLLMLLMMVMMLMLLMISDTSPISLSVKQPQGMSLVQNLDLNVYQILSLVMIAIIIIPILIQTTLNHHHHNFYLRQCDSKLLCSVKKFSSCEKSPTI